MKSTKIHKIITSFLTLVLFASIIKSTSTMIDFKINQDIIAKTLCVQKEDQQGCNGKCQLVKALKEDISQNTETPIPNNKNNILIYTYIQPINNFVFTSNLKIKIKTSFDGVHYRIIKKYYKVITPPPLV